MKKIEEEGDYERAATFKAGATEAVRFLLARYNDLQFYTGCSGNKKGALVFAYKKESTDEGRTFLMFVDGMRVNYKREKIVVH